MITLAEVPSEIRNNGVAPQEHKYNASYALNSVSQGQFQAMLQQAAQLATRPYDLTDFNCTSYALGIINA